MKVYENYLDLSITVNCPAYGFILITGFNNESEIDDFIKLGKFYEWDHENTHLKWEEI